MNALSVAPREISDIVNRCCRVHGVDPGVAQQIGKDVMAAHLIDGSALSTFADAARTADLHAFTITASSSTPAGDEAPDPYRAGVEVDAAVWSELHKISQAFLVSAELLDSFVDEED